MAKYVKKRSYKKSKPTKTARAVVKATKYLMLKSVETKYHTYGINGSMLGDAIYSFSPTQQVGVGNTAITRVGDKILLQNFILNSSFVIDAAILNAKVRILVGWTRKQTANTTLATGILDPSDIFLASAGSIPNVNRIVNTALFTPLYDQVFDVNSNTTTGRDVRSQYCSVNLGMKNFEYGAVGGSLGKTRNLVAVAMCWQPGAAYGGACGTWNLGACLKFKDP